MSAAPTIRLSSPVIDVPDPLQVGSVLSEKYMIERRLGGGGMGTVYAAINFVVNRRVAIKVMHAWVAKRADLVARFRTEARAAATIGHPNIVEILDMGRGPDGLPYVVMEYLEGEDLFERLSRAGPLAPDETVGVARQILAALGAAHSLGIIHCDLKPENVFLANRLGRRAVVKILDFGAAQVAAESGVDDQIFGTPAYMSPEQVAVRALDHRTDLYSVGVMIYEMLSGIVPYDGEVQEVLDAIEEGPPPRLLDVAPNVDPELARVVDHAMARTPSDRYPNAAALSAALEAFSGGSSHRRRWDDELPVLPAPIPLARVKASSATEVVWHPLMGALAVVFVVLALLTWRGPLRPVADLVRVEIAEVLRLDGARADTPDIPSSPRLP